LCRCCNGEACVSYITGSRVPVKKLTGTHLDLFTKFTALVVIMATLLNCKFSLLRDVLLAGCHLCGCNGHGDPLLGVCNNSSGVCYCTDRTVGNQCENCSKDHYGNPR